ncbi:6-phosphogluconolactonase [Streptodolium elevatio]|uniref:Glucosamine-6-phosphate deaminase n=1 Tax=Streptodolium elevatio TaxID=3157996 RepID=A0ABV3DBI3_9ACTN
MQAPLRPRVFAGPAELGRALAEEIADGIAKASAVGRRYVLGCPGGRSPKPVYDALAELVGERGLHLGHVVIAMMDEYVLPTGGPAEAAAAADTVDAGGTTGSVASVASVGSVGSGAFVDVDHAAHNSCHRFAAEEIVGPLNAAAGEGRGIPADAVWFPHPSDPAAYDGRLAEAGGVDLFILASGASDGHIAFNPPGAPEDSTSRIVELADSTRQDNMGTFPDFASLDEVPRHGVTVGVATIVRQSRRAVMVVHGGHKREAVRRLAAATAYEADWPATLVALCREPALYVDRAAAGEEFA